MRTPGLFPVGVAKFDATGRIEHANSRLGRLLAPVAPDELFGQAARGELPPSKLTAAFDALLHYGAPGLFVVEHVAPKVWSGTWSGLSDPCLQLPGP